MELKNSINPLDFIVEGTDIWIMPVVVVASNNPNKNYIYNIRHGRVTFTHPTEIESFDEDGYPIFKKLPRPKVVTDVIEDGTEFCGGFKTLADITRYAKFEAETSAEISKYANMGMFEHCLSIWQERNKTTREKDEIFFDLEKWETISKAWHEFHLAMLKATPKDNLDMLEGISTVSPN